MHIYTVIYNVMLSNSVKTKLKYYLTRIYLNEDFYANKMSITGYSKNRNID